MKTNFRITSIVLSVFLVASIFPFSTHAMLIRTSVDSTFVVVDDVNNVQWADLNRFVNLTYSGVLTEIDVKATLKKKIDVDVSEYKILGACNPKLAHHALETEPFIGLLLPCNIILFKDKENSTIVSIAKPTAMFQVVQNDALSDLANQVDEKMLRVLESL